VDAPAYLILKNLNIISTGVLYRIILKKSKSYFSPYIVLTIGNDSINVPTAAGNRGII